MLKNKKLLSKIIIIAVVAIAVIVAAIVLINKNSKSSRVNKLMQTANEYLTNLDYESAIASYKAAIEIDSKNVEAYLGLADAYVGLEDYDSAISVLNEGLAELPDNEELKDKIEEIQTIIDEKAAEEEKNQESDDNQSDETKSDTDDDFTRKMWVMSSAEIYHSYSSLPENVTYKYDNEGNLISESDYEHKYEYDKEGNIIYESVYYYDELVYECEYEKGLKTKVITYYDGYEEYEYEYDELEHIINETYIDWYGVCYNYEYEYDDHGNIIKSTSHYNESLDSDCSETHIKEYANTYDSNGYLISTTCNESFYFDIVQKIYPESTEVINYEYDVNGKILKITEVSKYSISYGIDPPYDVNGGGGSYSDFCHTTVYTYDEYGNETSKIIYKNSDGSIFESYEYTWTEIGITDNANTINANYLIDGVEL